MSLLIRAEAFLPNVAEPYIDELRTSLTHEDITEKAVMKMADIYMDDYSDAYPDREAAKETKDFKQALQQFRSAATEPAVWPQMKRAYDVHFFNEKLNEGQSRLLKQREEVSYN